MTGPRLSIIVPAFNEARRISLTLERSASHLRARGHAAEIIVVDDGSRDGTVAAAQAVMARFPDVVRVVACDENRGKGAATRRGVSEARGDVIGYMDADYKTPIEEIEKLLPALAAGSDLAIGSRQKEGAAIEVAQPAYRRLGSRAFSFVMHSLVGLRDISDTQCGFKFFRREAALRIFGVQRIDGYMFDVEVLALAERMGLRIAQIPIRWQNDPDSRYRVVSGTIRNARELLRIRSALRRSAAVAGAPSVAPAER